MSIAIPTNPADGNSIVNRLTMGETVIDISAAAVLLLSDLQAQYSCIVLTGTLTQDTTVTVPAEAKGWDIHNATAGAFTVTVNASGTTGVVVAQGAHQRLRYTPHGGDVVTWG